MLLHTDNDLLVVHQAQAEVRERAARARLARELRPRPPRRSRWWPPRRRRAFTPVPSLQPAG
ncbi:MAG: hypothetical protein S0880_30630 [Actinomycetota bacterium]|nr:hypothetical protein [Actinomycetota bacterium]